MCVFCLWIFFKAPLCTSTIISLSLCLLVGIAGLLGLRGLQCSIVSAVNENTHMY